MSNIRIENPWQYVGILLLLFGTAIVYTLFTDQVVYEVNGRKQIKKRFKFGSLLRLLFNHTGTWILTIRKHKTCRMPPGKADPLAVKVLIIYFLFFLNSGQLLYVLSLLYEHINLWEFQRLGLPNLEFVPYVGKHLLLISWCWNFEHPYISIWFNAIYVVLGLAGLNKTVDIWFTHSQKAKLVQAVILDDKDLPNNYDSIVQLNRDQVRVCYTGHSICGDVFVSKKKEISDGVGHEVDIQLGRYGEIYVTFGSPFRQVKPKGEWKQQEHRLVLKRPEDSKYEGFTYAFRTYAIHVGKHVLKIGKCTDPEATLKAYRRGTPHLKKFVLLVRQSRNFNESLVHENLKKYWVQSKDGRGGDGEFFEDCDAMWLIIRDMLKQLPKEDLIEVPEVLLNEETFDYK